ncbi:unnamed protein product [Gongylonema pulchrum]|uniref:Myotubularin phosphatase domain-containing protein n=1 Tax=Gongylonema pulchrum TaxID=637853 RepID=A0A183DXQ3_9BILA|nr:unnamed protein product [Gongylonema pulchrum]
MAERDVVPRDPGAGAAMFADRSSARLDSVDDFSHSLEVCNSMEVLRYTQTTGDGHPSAAIISDNDNLADVSEALPVNALPGEELDSTTDTGSGSVYVTNYRIVILDRVKNAVASIPLLSVDSVEFWSAEQYGIQIICKYGRVYRLRCASEVQVELHRRLRKSTCSIPTNDVFAWQFAKAAKEKIPEWLKMDVDTGDCECSVADEFKRLKYNPDFWKVSDVNEDYSLCLTYPKSLIVPKDMTDEELIQVSKARNSGRFPTAVWCCAKNESVLLRSSQPCCGIFNYRFPVDEKLLECARKAVSAGKFS